MEQNSSAICLVDLYFSINAIYVVTPVYVILFGKSVLVIWSICRAPVLPKNKKLLVISLSVCDVVSGLSQILTAAAHVLSPKFIIADIVIATLYVGGWFYCSTVYVVHLAAISIESYIYIAHPFYYIKTMKKQCIYIIIFCIWVLGLCTIFIPLTVYNIIQYQKLCIITRPPLAYYCTTAFIYIASCATVLISNFKIACLAFRRKIANMSGRQYGVSNAKCTGKLAAAIKSVTFFSLMFGVFFICSFPAVVCIGIDIFSRVPNYIFRPLISLLPAYSMLDFIIWYSMNAKFSEAIKRTFLNVKAFCYN